MAHTVKGAYKEALRYLYGLQKYGIKFGLSKTTNLLRAFGDPHLGQDYIHIGGTNGKGSVAAFITSVLREAGYRVGFYSSPHLVSFRERFKINDVPIGEEDVVRLVDEVRSAVVESEPPTFFEFTTAMALVYFARQETDIAVMEVGMGGRLDATNVITPRVSIITNIGMEHQFFLGNTLLEIAAEKAGIIKPGVPVLTGATQKKVVDLLRKMSREKGAPFLRLGEEIKFRKTARGLYFRGRQWHLGPLPLGLYGRFQARNAALALGCIEEICRQGFDISAQHVAQGLVKTRWPGRMQILSRNPLVVLDGAHNPSAMKAMVSCLKVDFQYDRLIVALGVMEDKDLKAIVKQIAPPSHHIIYTRPRYYRAAKPELLYSQGVGLHNSAEVIDSLDVAIEKAREMAGREDLVLICGSLFTVGEALSLLDPDNYPPEEIQDDEV